MLKIEKTHATQLHQLYKLERLCHASPWSFNALQECLHVGYLCHSFKILCKDEIKKTSKEVIIGFMVNQIILDECHLLTICIHPDFQGRGYATSVIKWLTKFLSQRGIKCILLEVRASNKQAIKLYESFKFAEIGIRKGYYPVKNGREDALVMKLVI